jgi:TrmH family RNA methyltransferase
MDSLSDTETSQGLLLVMPVTPLTLPATLDFVIVVDQLRDPGNLGTIIRSAKAAGVQAFFLTTGSVDVYSPKVIRSAMGAHFNLPILTMKWSEIHRLCLQQTPALKIVLAESENALPYWESDFRQPVALVIGGEANGPSEEVRNSVNENVKIPMPGGSESLNAAVAASILLFEVVRQRNQ